MCVVMCMYMYYKVFFTFMFGLQNSKHLVLTMVFIAFSIFAIFLLSKVQIEKIWQKKVNGQ